MHDLTEAIATAHAALDERFYPGPTEEMVRAAIEAAAPVIAGQVREIVAAEIRAERATLPTPPDRTLVDGGTYIGLTIAAHLARTPKETP